MTKFINNKRGFTFIELMMVVALLGIFLGIVYGFLNYNLIFLNQRNQEQATYHQARIAMYRITNLLRQNERVMILNDVPTDNEKTLSNIVTGDNGMIINFNKNTEQADESDLSKYKYYFYCANTGHGAATCNNKQHVGEIRDSSGNIVANGIKNFKLEYDHESENESEEEGYSSLIRITITVAGSKNINHNNAVLTTKIRLDRGYQY